ncbi:MAG: hypothetical protein B6I20_01285 [Bacteroidetes bacterium 4572_117]|nr:MAG: hypothetical protein B6I20_01285 [Bacteroidetes bacterium 4572_117]
MENLHIQAEIGNYYIPKIDFNAETGVCSISGKSFLEDTTEFYLPLLEWLDQFFREENKPIELNIKLTYYNTSSSRSILDIFDLLKLYEEKGGQVEVNWYSRDIDVEIIQEEVEDYMDESDLDINLVTYTD